MKQNFLFDYFFNLDKRSETLQNGNETLMDTVSQETLMLFIINDSFMFQN
jgi:hypothetical protein